MELVDLVLLTMSHIHMTTTGKKIVAGITFVLFVVLIYLLARYTDVFKVAPEYRDLSDLETQQLLELRRNAYDYAVNCSNTENPVLKFEDITWALMPGNELRFPTTDAGTVELKGWFSPKDSVIYIPFSERETFWIHAHESMHAIGYIGHPYIPFKTCSLMADQNP